MLRNTYLAAPRIRGISVLGAGQVAPKRLPRVRLARGARNTVRGLWGRGSPCGRSESRLDRGTLGQDADRPERDRGWVRRNANASNCSELARWHGERARRERATVPPASRTERRTPARKRTCSSWSRPPLRKGKNLA